MSTSWFHPGGIIHFIFVGELRGLENFKIEVKNKIKKNRKNRHFAITFCVDCIHRLRIRLYPFDIEFPQ